MFIMQEEKSIYLYKMWLLLELSLEERPGKTRELRIIDVYGQ